MQYYDPVQPHPKKRRWVYVIVILSIVSVVGLIAMLYKNISAPVQGTLVQQVSPVSQPEAMPQNINGLYATFTVSPAYQLQNKDPDSSNLERYVFSGKPMDDRLLAVTISPLPVSGKLEDVSSYRMRQLDTSTYSEERHKVYGKELILVKNKTQFEWVGYITNNGMLATIALSSKDPDPQQLAKEYNSLLNSWEWK